MPRTGTLARIDLFRLVAESFGIHEYGGRYTGAEQLSGQLTLGLSPKDGTYLAPEVDGIEKTERPRRDLNPCYRRERPVS